MPVSLVSVDLVATWTWDGKTDDTCGICRQLFDACCPVCTVPGDECPIVTGKCTHSFHMHCIEKWTERERDNPHCPMCRGEWDYKTD
jgi:anaphase-promoting complex subunit 11